MTVAIRAMQDSDLEAIAQLSGQRVEGDCPEAFALRLRWLGTRAAHENAFFVAHVGPDCTLVGFVHVQGITLLGAIAYAEISSLVVDHAHRRRGIGRLLVSRGERWAREHAFATMRLRHDRTALSTQHFYRQLGYAPTPSSARLHKSIDAA